MDKQKVLSLGGLARMSISDAEAERLSHEFESILKYVGEVSKLGPEESKAGSAEMLSRNRMREDGHPHESGLHTEKLLALAPEREDNYFKVKKIL